MFGLFGRLMIKLMGGTRNERVVRSRMKWVVEEVNPLEESLRSLSDEDILRKSMELRRRVAGGEDRRHVKAEAFALVREASSRARMHRHFDVQLLAGHILDEGMIAEEATGEGKTIACYPAIYMAWLDGMHTHVVTTNDYLVQRDAEFARPVFEMLGMSVGFITSEMPTRGQDASIRKAAYACDVTYGTNNELGFDYLRDNMSLSVAEQVQGPLDFAIVDEVDNILIDEARTPLIISGPAYGDVDRYRKADAVARELISRNRSWDRLEKRASSLEAQIKALNAELAKGAKGSTGEKNRERLEKAQMELENVRRDQSRHVKLYEVELDKKSAHMTHEGVSAAQEIAGVGSFYVGANMEWPHLMEQALRAHLAYERDRDYVVQDGQVVIVDEFTGRLMEGRQWSDGLHQAIESKERVQVKEETQTMATITLQNFFKLYRKLAGMTGTAMTEADEFLKIYKLDCVAVATHRPINRADYNDRIYADQEAKYNALVEEIRFYSRDLHRPVLVGTTSIAKSEKLSEMLTRSYGIEHQVLNGRVENAARENEIVDGAGQLRPLKKDSKELVGTVTIATNMAGRGTDIKLGAGVVCPSCKVPSPEKLASLGLEVEDLFPEGTTKCCIHCPQYNPSTSCSHCFKPKIDDDFPKRGRSDCPGQVPCGLHMVGTERHEARRIDNQLRGRAGRQGDPGSSRFFLSIRDDLISIFAGPLLLKILGWLGLQGDAMIEDKRVSKGIERAQKKVEQRNFEIRKNLLEYDEVMDYQRRDFYSRRQRVLEGRRLEGMVREMIASAVAQAAADYFDGRYQRRCIAEWAAQALQIPLRDDQVRGETPEDLPALEESLRARAKEEAASVISITLGEYMGEDADARDWDLRGLSSWAMSRLRVEISQNQLRKMTPLEVEETIYSAACERIDEIDLSPLSRFLQQDFPAISLAEWARSKFDIDVSPGELGNDAATAVGVLQEKVDHAYARREIEYPVEYAMDITIGQQGLENVYALESLASWANRKFDAGFSAEDFRKLKPEAIFERLVGMSEEFLVGGKLDAEIRTHLGADPSPEAAAQFASQRFDTELNPREMDGDVLGYLGQVGRQFLRREMTELERFVLLQILDSSWKDHLLAMDHLKSGIGLRGYAEQDPRVAYKREGAQLYEEMLAGVEDKVSDMIFKVRLGAESQLANVYQISSMVHEQLSGYDHLAQQMADQEAAAQPRKVQQIVRDVPKVGRNDPCPCGSGKKYKKCCGKN